MKAEIITIGDEILIGQIVDTNSAWMAQQLNQNGIEVFQITSVHDSHTHIFEALSNASKAASLVLLTGGLGPTKDDITKNVLCDYFSTKLVFHEPTFQRIADTFSNRGIDLNKLNRDQALVPEGCTVLENKAGTAPGLWFEKDGTIFVSMPGVPFEMKYLVTEEILPRLKKTGLAKAIYHKTVLTQGVPESMLADKLEDWENKLPLNISLAYLPSPMAVRLRLSAMGENEEALKGQVSAEIQKLQKLIPQNIFGFDNDKLAGVIGEILKEKGKTLALAESCTGGNIAHLITLIPGCSDYFKGSVTAYSNEIKQALLGVKEESLDEFGAVSEQVALEMATGVKKALNTDYAVATTGIAGPDGGSEEKPVGTVWIAVTGEKRTFARKFVFGNNRERNIIRSSQTALQLLRRFILKEL